MIAYGTRAVEALSALSRRHPGDDMGAVGDHLAGVEGAVAAGDPLDLAPRVLVDEDAHAAFPPFAYATACLTAASMSERAVIPAFWRIRNAWSSLVQIGRASCRER